MKRYMLSILPLFLTLCLMAGCGGRSGMHSRLAAVDSIVDSRYDSALTVLRGMDTLQMRRSDRMYLELLRAKAMNKASVPFTTDSVMRRVARYYDRHGSPNQRLLAHYLLGCVYRDLRSAPRALQEYQRAVSQADTTRADCDFPTLLRAHTQMYSLYLELRMPELQRKECLLSEQMAWKMGDTLSALSMSQYLCKHEFEKGEYEKCIALTDSLYQRAVDIGWQSAGEVLCINAVKSTYALGRYEEMRKYLDIYGHSTIRQSDPRMIRGGVAPLYNYEGMYHLAVSQLDSAEFFFHKALQHVGMFSGNALLAYKGLTEVHAQRHQPDSIIKYTSLYSQIKEHTYNESNARALIQAQHLYNYSVEQRIARQKSIESSRWRIGMMIAVLVIIVCIYIVIKKRRERKVILRTLNEKIHLLGYYEHILQHLREEKQQLAENIERAESNISEIKEKADSTKKQNDMTQKEVAQLQSQIVSLQTEREEKERKISELEENYNQLKAQIREAQERYSHQSLEKKRRLNHSEVVKRLHLFIQNPIRNPKPGDEDWKQLRHIVDEIYPTFFDKLEVNRPLSDSEKIVCMLILAGFSPERINTLLDKSTSFATNTRTRLYKKIFGVEGKATDFDQEIIALAQEREL